MIFALISFASGNLAFTAEHETPQDAFTMTPAATPRGLMAGGLAGMLPIVMAAFLAIMIVALALTQDDAEPAELEENKRPRVRQGVKKQSLADKADEAMQKLMKEGNAMIGKKNAINKASLEHAQKDEQLALAEQQIRNESGMRLQLVENEVANAVMDADAEQQKLDNVVAHLEDQAYGGRQVNGPVAVVIPQGPMGHIPGPQAAGQQKQFAGQW